MADAAGPLLPLLRPHRERRKRRRHHCAKTLPARKRYAAALHRDVTPRRCLATERAGGGRAWEQSRPDVTGGAGDRGPRRGDSVSPGTVSGAGRFGRAPSWGVLVPPPPRDRPRIGSARPGPEARRQFNGAPAACA